MLAFQHFLGNYPTVIRGIMALVRLYALTGIAMSKLCAWLFSYILMLPDIWLARWLTSGSSKVIFASNGTDVITTKFRLFIQAYARNNRFNVAEYQRVFKSIRLILHILHGVDPQEYEISIDTNIIRYQGKPYALLFNTFCLDGSDCVEDESVTPTPSASATTPVVDSTDEKTSDSSNRATETLAHAHTASHVAVTNELLDLMNELNK